MSASGPASGDPSRRSNAAVASSIESANERGAAPDAGEGLDAGRAADGVARGAGGVDAVGPESNTEISSIDYRLRFNVSTSSSSATVMLFEFA